MLANQFTTLTDTSGTGAAEALQLVSAMDESLTGGFARLDPRHGEALSELAGALSGTPLGAGLATAVDKILAGSVGEEELTFVAAARSALLGAVHDDLVTGLDSALERTRAPWSASQTASSPVAANLRNAARSWLMELAVTGWRGIDDGLVSSVNPTIEALLAEPAGRRLAVLLDGLAAELRGCAPLATMDRVPARRWADLWTRAVLLTRESEPKDTVDPTVPITGRLLILGVDVHEHPTAFQAQIHGIVEPPNGGQTRLVRAAVSAAKVDTIVGSALWRLLTGHPNLLAAIAGSRALDITDMPVTDGGDLLWNDESAAVGDPVDPFVTGRIQLAGTVAAAVPPLERHPVRIAEPVLVEGYKAKKPDGGVCFDLGGAELAVDLDRLPSCGPLTAKLVAASTACIGLMRWDAGRWSLQPLAVQAPVKRVPTIIHNGEWAMGPTDPKVAKAEARAGDSITVLRERAGRLLRR